MAEPESDSKKKLVPMARTGFGTKGRRISLLSNHFKVRISKVDDYFFHYSVNISYEDGQPVEAKGVGRKLITRVIETYHTELDGKNIAYDGDKSLYSVGSLPNNKLEFVVLLEDVVSSRNKEDDSDRKRIRRPYQSKTFKVELTYAAKIPIRAITNAIRGEDSPDTQEALRVLDIILRQNASNQGCLLVRQSFFHNDPKNFVNLNGGVLACRGFHSSFRGTQAGLSLNIDVSTTMILRPGPVLEFLIDNQNVQRPSDINWAKAKRMLKSMRVKTATTNQDRKIIGLSDSPCNRQKFLWRRKGSNGDVEETEITVYDYFVKIRKTHLRESAGFPCINIGRPKSPTFIPIELCSLVSLQRYTKALTNLQRASLVEKSRQKPQERMNVLSNALRSSRYDSDPVLNSCGISISRDFVQIEGRVLPTPMLKVGDGMDLSPQNGRWNFNNKKLVEPKELRNWAVVSFSKKCNLRRISGGLINVCRKKGVVRIEDPKGAFEESSRFSAAPPSDRVDEMFHMLKKNLRDPPLFILCVLPDKKNSELYGPWKKKCLSEVGIVTQCMAATANANDQYLTNLLLKITAKLGGLNSILADERTPAMRLVHMNTTMILGMDVSHGSPGHSDFPSIAAVVGSQHWPSISKYKACVRTQSSKVEMIDNLFKPVTDQQDHGIMRELLDNFQETSKGRLPEQIIIFRDGVSESQFNQVLNIELSQIIEACKFRAATWNPKFVVIVAQKNHHTKFFQPGNPHNVPPGTIIDREVCHPRNYDFYLCAHAGMIGTTRPTHYHILHDEIGISPNDLEELVHSLSYVYQRSTTAISVVSPIRYAHLAAAQMGQWIKLDDGSETSSSRGEMTVPNALPVPQLPTLKREVASSMFFC